MQKKKNELVTLVKTQEWLRTDLLDSTTAWIAEELLNGKKMSLKTTKTVKLGYKEAILTYTGAFLIK